MVGSGAWAAPAGAFYWYGPPDKSIITPPGKHGPGDPPNGHHHKPPVTPPVVVPPESVPEPATLVGTLLGLGTLAGMRVWRRRT